MNDEELELLYQEFVSWYGKPLPSLEHCPLECDYLLTLFKYYRNKNE